LNYAEVFAGAGGLSLGLERAGFNCKWHCEIEPRARRVLEKNWPFKPCYGDIRGLKGQELVREHGRLNLLSGGSPCQDMSIAGKRKGLRGEKSVLFFEQMRLWDETEAPLCLWENVCGALSSNQGKDFARVLSAFVGGRITVPRSPRSHKRIPWARSGVVVGSTGVAAWRVINARFFGVPQKRRRVIILGSRSRAFDPAEILLECKSVYGDSDPRKKSRKSSARSFEEGTIGSDEKVLSFHHKQDPDAHTYSPPLGITAAGMGVLNRLVSFGEYVEDDVSSAIQSRDYKYVTDIVVVGRPRRFMPVECERLMSWPDNWTLAGDEKDTPRYILCGNGIVSNCAEWIGRRILNVAAAN
jgi:DNA (cytosine-5)-methyltransferase 1